MIILKRWSFLFLFWGVINISFSQEVNVLIGGGYTDIRKSGDLIDLYEGDSSFNLYHAPLKKKVREYTYDSVLNYKTDNLIDISKEEDFLNSIVFKGKRYLFFYERKKTSSSLYYKMISENGFLEASKHFVDEYVLEEGQRKITSNPYSLQLSEDKNRLLIYRVTDSSIKNNKDKTYSIFLFDSNMKKIKTVKRTYPVYYKGNSRPPLTLNIRKFFVNSNDQIFFLYYNYDALVKSSVLHWCDVLSGADKEITLADDRFITETKVITGLNGKLTLFGIYTNKNDKFFYSRGLFLVGLDKLTPKYIPFSDEDVKSFEFVGGAVMGRKLKLFEINNITYTKDGGFVLLFQNTFSRFSNGGASMSGGAAFPNGGGAFGHANMTGTSTLRYGSGPAGTTLYHFDFAVIKVSSTNELEWFKHVSNRKHSLDCSGSVFYYNEKTDKTFVVYNTISKMLKPISLNVLTFNNDGAFSDKVLFAYKDIKSLLKFSYQKKIADNTFIVPGFRIGRESYFKLIKISFN